MKSKVFVFGSNLRGIHGAGAALYARNHHGAQLGVGIGRTGNSYAIPTKDENIKTLSLERIKVYVDQFIEYALTNSDLEFEVTAIGTGLAGYTHFQIAPMFINAPSNCSLPTEWLDIISRIKGNVISMHGFEQS